MAVYGLLPNRAFFIIKMAPLKLMRMENGIVDDIAGRIFQDKIGSIWMFTPLYIYKMINNRFIPQQVIFNESLRLKALNDEGDFMFAFQWIYLQAY